MTTTIAAGNIVQCDTCETFKQARKAIGGQMRAADHEGEAWTVRNPKHSRRWIFEARPFNGKVAWIWREK